MGAGLDPASSGQVWVDGELVTRPNRHVAFMLQKDLLLPWRTIVENVELGQEIRARRGASAASARSTFWPSAG
jgi:ABC-type nitrate/sulfonate/bicarbonate transport system, ATPase component